MSLESKAKSTFQIVKESSEKLTPAKSLRMSEQLVEQLNKLTDLYKSEKWVSLEEAQKLEAINKNMAECNEFRAKQIEALEDEVDNLKGQLKFADANILKLASQIPRKEETGETKPCH